MWVDWQSLNCTRPTKLKMKGKQRKVLYWPPGMHEDRAALVANSDAQVIEERSKFLVGTTQEPEARTHAC